MRSAYRSALAGITYTLAAVLMIGTPATAQRTRSSSTLTEIDRAKDELNLTEEQQTKLKEVAASASPDYKSKDGAGRKYLEAMRELEGEARDQKRKEFAAESARMREEAGAKALAILTPSQRKQFAGILINKQGSSALVQEAIVNVLRIDEDQRKKIEAALAERSKKIREQGVRVSRDEREKLRAELDKAVLANLTGDQQKSWDSLAAGTGDDPTSNAPRSSITVRTTPTPLSTAAERSTPTVASFGDTIDKDGKVTFNFDGEPWPSVLKFFARVANLTLDMHDQPPGSLKHFDPNKYTPREALDVMNGCLLREGYLAVQKDNFLIVWAFDEGLPPSLVPEISPEELIEDYSDVDNQLLTVAFKMETGDVEQMAREIDATLDPYSFVRIAALTGSNTLIVTDLSVNLRKVKRMIDDTTGKIVFKQFPIENMGADEASVLVRSQLGLPPSSTNVSESRTRRTSSAPATETTVTPDNRTNSLLVSATPQQIKRVEEVLAAIDVSEGPDGPLGRGSNIPILEVYTMTASNVEEVGKTIEAIMPGRIINEDVRAKKLHIKAVPREHEEIRGLIAKLDKGGGGDGAVAVIHLHELEALAAAQMLTTMFAKESDGGPVIQADTFNQRLVCRGNSEQLEQIKTVLLQLGEDGTLKVKDRANRGPTMKFPLGGRDPQKFLNALESLWQSPEANRIRIVVPSKSSPIKNLGLPGRELKDTFKPTSDSASKGKQFNKRRTTQRSSNEVYTYAALFQDDDDKNAEMLRQFNAVFGDEDDQPKPVIGDPNKPELMVTVQGDTLIVTSADDDALTRAEEMIEMLNQTMPVRNTWTVFYLTSADCTEAAAMLEQLFPTSSVASAATDSGTGLMGGLTSGLTSFGSSLMDMTGLNTIGSGPQTLRIIPETRSNALFVAGPEYLVSEVEDMLQVLDMSELPQSGRDLVPREAIHLLHADANTVGDKIKELFKTYTEAQRAPGQANNPLAMMMGGGGGGGKAQPTPVRLAVTVDEATNRIYCACSEQLYRQIREVAEQMDQDMRAANPGIKVYTLRNANAQAAVQTIQNMLPRVRVNTAGSNGRPGSSSSSSNTSQEAAAAAARAAAMRNAAASGAFGGFGGGNTGRGGISFGTRGRGTTGGGRGGGTGRGGRGGGR